MTPPGAAETTMNTIAIAGVGLIGGSLGLALRKAGFTGTILGISSPKTIEAAIEKGAIDRGVTLEEAARVSDVLYLAQPISIILENIDRLVPMVRPDCLVTDAGSTKVQITERARRLPLFLGGHPMAGKEATGVGAAEADLFRGRPYVLTPYEGVIPDSPAVGGFLHWLKLCGAVSVFLSPSEHDSTVAWTSHLPQFASTALACTLHQELSPDQLVNVSGPGLRDLTRLALSSWSIWEDIVETNTVFIQHVLSVYIDTLTEMRDNLQTQRTGEDFSIAAEVALKIRRGIPKNQEEI